MSALHKHETSILEALKKKKTLGLDALLEETGLGKDEAIWAIDNLSKKDLITVRKEEKGEAKLTKEGEEYAGKELPEQALIRTLVSGRVEIGSLKSKSEQIGLMWAKKKDLVAIENKYLKLTEKGKEAAARELTEDKILKELRDKGNYAKYKDSEEVRELEKRGLLEIKSREELKEVEITQKGILSLAKERQSEAPEIDILDRSMIQSRAWVGRRFKEYNVGAPVEAKEVAMKHPLRRLMEEARQAYLSLGFTEVSGPVIESSFWVFDYLFIPQHNPVRDMQETFFLSNPSKIPIEDRELVKRVKGVHEEAWHSEWSEEIAMRAVPRTHMTSVTGKYMRKIISDLQENPNSHELPVKIFSIGRVFRNENIDYKHLADFYQMDGMIIGRQLTLANLFDVLIKLYSRLGIKITFKPSFFPYVEPGVEAYAKFKGSEIELFGAGMIRNEITGIKRKSISVLAWGPGIERLMLLRDPNISSISSMFNTNAGWLRKMSMR